jgi:hypothetical protein
MSIILNWIGPINDHEAVFVRPVVSWRASLCFYKLCRLLADAASAVSVASALVVSTSVVSTLWSRPCGLDLSVGPSPSSVHSALLTLLSRSFFFVPSSRQSTSFVSNKLQSPESRAGGRVDSRQAGSFRHTWTESSKKTDVYRIRDNL